MKTTLTSGGIVINPYGEIVIVNQNNNSWSLPKGHVEKNEDLLCTAYREIYEETGLKELQFIQKCGHYQRHKIGLNKNEDTSELKHIHMYMFTTNSMTLTPIDPKNPKAKWETKENVSKLLTHPKDKLFFNEVIPILNKFTEAPIEISITFPNKEMTKNITNYLIKNNLAACIQTYGPVLSTYTWENKIEEDKEFIFKIKTKRNNLKDIESYIKNEHSYDCPQFIVTTIEFLSSDYSDWLTSNCN